MIANACASGTNAIGHAFECIRSGRYERVLTGGYDALSELVFVGFDSLQAATPEKCRPFDGARSGLVLGEGAAVLALENLDAAEARGAEILAEITGYGISTDNHHLTQPHPSGIGPRQAMERALQSAGSAPEAIDYINAHGTATPFNDATEGEAIAELFGRVAGQLDQRDDGSLVRRGGRDRGGLHDPRAAASVFCRPTSIFASPIPGSISTSSRMRSRPAAPRRGALQLVWLRRDERLDRAPGAARHESAPCRPGMGHTARRHDRGGMGKTLRRRRRRRPTTLGDSLGEKRLSGLPGSSRRRWRKLPAIRGSGAPARSRVSRSWRA